MTPKDITVAITVFDRRAYIEQAVASALGQTLPVRVIVVEDCGPDPGLQSFVISKFGSRISYHRNPKRRGLFDNWNVCLDLCSTPWLCLLHDDDFLEPRFVEEMVELATKMPGKGLYYGRCRVVDGTGTSLWVPPERRGPNWWCMDVVEAALVNPIAFPGELFRADYAKGLGGFRGTSLFTGDWDMSVKLALRYGAAGTNCLVGNIRIHSTEGRGTVRVVRNGKVRALNIMQIRKNVALLRKQGLKIPFDRLDFLTQFPVPTRELLEDASGFSDRMLAYNVGLLVCSPSQTIGHFLFQTLARCLGPRFVRTASGCYRRLGLPFGREKTKRAQEV